MNWKLFHLKVSCWDGSGDGPGGPGLGGPGAGSGGGSGASGPGDAAAGADPSSSGDPTSGGFGGTVEGGGVGSATGQGGHGGLGIGIPSSYGGEDSISSPGMLGGYSDIASRMGMAMNDSLSSMVSTAIEGLSDDPLGVVEGLGNITGITAGNVIGGILGGFALGLPGVITGSTLGGILSGEVTPGQVVAAMTGFAVGLPTGLQGSMTMAGDFVGLADTFGDFSFGDEVDSDTTDSGASDPEPEKQSTMADFDANERWYNLTKYGGGFASFADRPDRDEASDSSFGSGLAGATSGTMVSQRADPEVFSTAKVLTYSDEEDVDYGLLW